MEQAREQTVASLAQSRFDWERVLRELAIVIPQDVWLTNLTAAVSADAASSESSSSASGSSDSGSADNIEGPSLHIQGCAAGHEAVASFLAALQDMDGVTRVSVLNSDLPDATTGGAAAGASDVSGAACSTRDFVSQFQVVAAFDEVKIDPTTQGIAPEPATTVVRPKPGRRRSAAASTAKGLGRPEGAEGTQGRGHLHPGDGTTP